MGSGRLGDKVWDVLVMMGSGLLGARVWWPVIGQHRHQSSFGVDPGGTDSRGLDRLKTD